MPVEVTVTKNITAQVAAAIHAAVGAAVDLSAHAIGVEAIAMIETGQKSGRIYGTHQASAPGEAPASVTGALVGTIDAVMTGETEAEVRAGGGAVNYAAELELGSVSGRDAARPFMAPAAEAGKKPYIDAVTQAVRKACGG
jgi:hypothetical protein